MFKPIIVLFVSEGDVPGLSEEDMAAAVATLQIMAETQNAQCTLLRKRQEKAGCVEEFLMRKRAAEADFMEVRYVHYTFVTAMESQIFI